ncbi:exonuclease V [Gastrophryne carolinensis]
MAGGTEQPDMGDREHAPAARETEQQEDDFSDISDSELVTLQEAVESGEAYEAEGGGRVGDSDLNGVETSGQQPRPAESTQERKRKQEWQNPLEKYSMKYLTVTDICSQIWCEQQMVYKIEQPKILQPEKMAVINEGASIHLARELEAHDLVSVTTQSREDSWAIKCLNVLAMIPVLQRGGRIREFPVFGELDGIFVVGVIDELGYSPKGDLELRELKTRATPTLPRSAQRKCHAFQVCLYKKLFDDLVSGALQSEVLIQHLNLQPQRELGPEVKEHAMKSGLTVSTCKDIIDLTCLNLTYSELPRVDCLKLEYCFQVDGSSLGCDIVKVEEESVMEQLRFYFAYWKGLRDHQGVDIEDAWKCRMCDYANICEWRIQGAIVQPYRTMTKRFK